MTQSLKVAVIGAGVSGLCAARELQREGHQVTVFEKRHQLGGTWLYDPGTDSDPLGVDPNRKLVHSSLYHSLRTNLPRQLMGFLDFPFPNRQNGDSRTFPAHEEVLWFLNNFAEDFGLRKFIRFNTEVLRVERVKQKKDKWVVVSKTLTSDSLEQGVFQAVVICSGHVTEPRLAEIPGIEKWPGYQIHSHNYRVPEPFRNKVVVLIGFGSSAFDISRDVATVAKEVHITTRNPNVRLTKMENSENIWLHLMIKCVYEDSLVAFEDGSSVSADVILHCTGYKYHFPFLETNGIITIEDNRVDPLYKHVFPPTLAPWLSFIGMFEKDIIFQTIDLQCKWVARVLSGKVPLPKEKEMMAYVEEYYTQMEQNGVPKRYTHYLHFKEVGYGNWLAGQVALPPVPEWREEMYLESLRNIYDMKDCYKDQWDDARWDSAIKDGSVLSEM